MSTASDYLRKVKSRITEIAPESIESRQLIDVREGDETANGIAQDALLIPRGLLESRIESTVSDRATPLAIYCASGVRSAYATDTLQQLGYTNVVSVKGGYAAWKSTGLKTTVPHQWSPDELSRYARHFALAEVGMAGQEQLLNSRVLLVGAGGLGSPIALYLAAAGVGHIGLVDDDRVDRSNLQRQIAHTEERIGEWKTASAKIGMLAINPGIDIQEYRTRISADNVRDIVTGYDIVIDGVDNLATRYVLNEATVRLGIPLVSGSVLSFDGQVSVFAPDGPCYRCLYPDPPPAELAPSCAASGVLGVIPGIIGLQEAVETLKLLLNVGESLNGRVQLYDAYDSSWTTLRVHRDPDCKTCAHPQPIEAEFEDFVELCAGV